MKLSNLFLKKLRLEEAQIFQPSLFQSITVEGEKGFLKLENAVFVFYPTCIIRC